MTTNTTTANLYPFVTKAQLKTRLETDPAFRKEAICLVYKLQTEWEQNKEATKDRNRQGFMSSHATNGSRVAKKILAGEELDEKDLLHVDTIAPRYTRQLACFYRAKAIAEQPALKEVAAMFSADGAADMAPAQEETAEAAE